MAPKPSRERDIEEDRDTVSVGGDDTDTTSMLNDREEDVDGPDNAEARREQEAEARRRADRREPTDREVDDDQDARLAYDDDEGDVGDAQERGGRRSRRNRAKRLRDEQNQQQIAGLTQRVVELQGHLEQMSRGQLSLAAGDIDSQIQTEHGRLPSIDAALARAVKEADDVTYAKAMSLRDEARDRIQQLGNEKYRLAVVARQGAQPAQAARPAVASAPDPMAVRYSQKFMDRHDWFDPEDSSDEDSLAVKEIDDDLAREGYLPGKKAYWLELERRVAKAGLGGNTNVNEREDDTQDRQQDRPPPRRTGGLPPRSGGTGGRQRSAGGRVSLTQPMQEALEAEGLLEVKGLTDDQLKLRRKYVKTWTEGLKAAESAGGRR